MFRFITIHVHYIIQHKHTFALAHSMSNITNIDLTLQQRIITTLLYKCSNSNLNFYLGISRDL